MTKILIITSDIQLSRNLNYALSFNGFTVECASTPAIAKKCMNEIKFSIILIDFKFKTTERVSFSKEHRGLNAHAAIVGMGESYDEVLLIERMYKELNDYIIKPFNLSELKMIINKQLERSRYITKPIIYGSLKIDVARSIVTVKDKIISLGKKEMEVLTVLASKAGKIVTPDKLMTTERIRNIKMKLSIATGETVQIKSVSRHGFKLITTESCA